MPASRAQNGPTGSVNRRVFLTRSLAAAGALPAASALAPGAFAGAEPVSDVVRKALEPYVVPRSTVDAFLDPQARMWARFHPVYGYLLRSSFVRDGVDGSHTLARYETTGQRWQVNFRDQPCRLNSYGDSFTQGHQVSDGETWQEVLAAHFLEPIRNFGIGGFGVYQAYRRLRDVEASELGAANLIFNIFGDDHYRSLYAYRYATLPVNWLTRWQTTMFNGSPWAHARLDPHTGALVERDSLCPDEATFRRLAELDFLVETFGRDEILLAQIAQRQGLVVDQSALERLAAPLRESIDVSSESATRATATRLLDRYATRVGVHVMERLAEFCRDKGKKLIVLLSYPGHSVLNACAGRKPGDAPDNVDWHPPEIREVLAARKIPVVDSVEKHVAEFKTFRLSPKEYVDRYYIGHYNPVGNNFFAYAVKNEILAWLDPKPPAYQAADSPPIRFQGYLPG
ncbi:MAG: hypothetical protein ACT4QC_01680 [Planctomycetaceae bacterium]